MSSVVSKQFLTDLFNLMNAEVEYAVLRNFEGLPDNNDSRDIDIAISRKDCIKLKSNLISLLAKQGWKLITLLESDRLVTWVVAYLDNKHCTELVQFDFFFNTSVFGVELMSVDELLADRKFNGKIYHASEAVQFLDKYVYDRAVGAKYPEKYSATRKHAENNPVVTEKLNKLFGCKSVAECDNLAGRESLKRAIKRQAFGNPAKLAMGMAKFIGSFTGNYLRSRTGFSVGFTGPDGSGKTTVIDRTIERLDKVFATAHCYYHFRPALFGNLGDVAHSAGLKKEVDRNYSDPHRGGKTGMASSLARLGYYSVDYILGYFAKVKSQTRITKLVIFDRYFTDIICDSRRSRIYLSPKFLNLWRKLFIPSLDYNILLTASSETILARKRELDEAGIRAINERIDYLAPKQGYLKVLNESTPDQAVTTILNHIFEQQHRKNLKRLK